MPIKMNRKPNKNAHVNNIKTALVEAEYDVLKEIGEEAIAFMKKYVETHWYNTYDPKDYSRTFAFRDSITYSIIRNRGGQSYRLLIYWSMKELQAIRRQGTWSAHQGFDGNKFTWGLVEWIDQGGFEGGILTNPRRLDGGINISDAVTSEVLNKYINKEAIERIRTTIRSSNPYK